MGSRVLAGVPIRPTEEEVGIAGLSQLAGGPKKFISAALPAAARVSTPVGYRLPAAARFSGTRASQLPALARTFQYRPGGVGCQARISGLVRSHVRSQARLLGKEGRARESSARLTGRREAGRRSQARVSGHAQSQLPLGWKEALLPKALGSGLFGSQLFGARGATSTGAVRFASWAHLIATGRCALVASARLAAWLPTASKARISGLEAVGSQAQARLSGCARIALAAQARLVARPKQQLAASARVATLRSQGLPSFACTRGVAVPGAACRARLSGYVERQLPCDAYLRPLIAGFGATRFGGPAPFRLRLGSAARLSGTRQAQRISRAQLTGSKESGRPSRCRISIRVSAGVAASCRLRGSRASSCPADSRLRGANAALLPLRCFLVGVTRIGTRARVRGTCAAAIRSRALVLEKEELRGYEAKARIRGWAGAFQAAKARLFRFRRRCTRAVARLMGRVHHGLPARAALSAPTSVGSLARLSGRSCTGLPSRARLAFIPYGQLGRVPFGQAGFGWVFVGRAYRVPAWATLRGARSAALRARARLTLRREVKLPTAARASAHKVFGRPARARLRGACRLGCPMGARLGEQGRVSVASRTYLLGHFPTASVCQEPIVKLTYKIRW